MQQQIGEQTAAGEPQHHAVPPPARESFVSEEQPELAVFKAPEESAPAPESDAGYPALTAAEAGWEEADEPKKPEVKKKQWRL